MIKIGYALSSEEHHPNSLVANARMAEQSGFEFASLSDHFHPWISQQGHSPFVWSVLGGIAQATERIIVGTGVTCPIIRTHPVIIAQAAATAAAMMPGRFFLGVGTGEYLNEHILGHAWPPDDIRQEMLAEAIYVIKELWYGDEYTHDGIYYTVRDARLYTLPDEPPPIYVAASGPESAELAAEAGDGLISTTSGDRVVKAFKDSGGLGKPCIGGLKVCWAKSLEEAQETIRTWWPVSELSGRLHADLPTPEHFEDAVELMGEPKIAEDAVLGPEPEAYIEALRKLEDNGYDHVYIHQVGPDQAGFFEFFKSKLLPLLEQEELVKEIS